MAVEDGLISMRKVESLVRGDAHRAYYAGERA
jgi:hypothetical protein